MLGLNKMTCSLVLNKIVGTMERSTIAGRLEHCNFADSLAHCMTVIGTRILSAADIHSLPLVPDNRMIEADCSFRMTMTIRWIHHSLGWQARRRLTREQDRLDS